MRPKFNYVRSKAILEACRAIPCQHCGAQDGTVVAAHSNWHTKGMSIKASDEMVASLCHSCHMQIDQGSLFTKSERKSIWYEAHVKTWNLLHDLGLYPSNIDYKPEGVTYES